jgi:hypothetical protein
MGVVPQEAPWSGKKQTTTLLVTQSFMMGHWIAHDFSMHKQCPVRGLAINAPTGWANLRIYQNMFCRCGEGDGRFGKTRHL